MSTMRTLLNIIINLCVFLNWGCTEGAKVRGSGETCSHTIQVTSLIPTSSSSSCLPSKASLTKSSLHVMHRHGPCSHLISGKATTSPNHDDIFKHDQARVDSIQSKFSTNRVMPSKSTDFHSSTIKAKDWNLGSGIYVVKIGIGTPKQDLSLTFDTGSDLTWVQCQPCPKTKCYPQKEPMFNPSSSSSYHTVSCPSPDCDFLSKIETDFNGVCSNSSKTCSYNMKYGDDSISRGFLATDKFTLTSSDISSEVFGCGTDNKGEYGEVAGLLGLGPGNISFPSRTAKTYNKVFSYCLPSSGTLGHLTFGSVGISKSVKYSPVSSSSDISSSFYSLDIEGITVCDKQLEIPSGVFSTKAVIIDSGTLFTRLPHEAYKALQSAFKEKMSNYTVSSSSGGHMELDTCYDFTGLKTVTIPKIAFTFAGGNVVELHPKGILYPYNNLSTVCLAFVGNKKEDKRRSSETLSNKRYKLYMTGRVDGSGLGRMVVSI